MAMCSALSHVFLYGIFFSYGKIHTGAVIQGPIQTRPFMLMRLTASKNNVRKTKYCRGIKKANFSRYMVKDLKTADCGKKKRQGKNVTRHLMTLSILLMARQKATYLPDIFSMASNVFANARYGTLKNKITRYNEISTLTQMMSFLNTLNETYFKLITFGVKKQSTNQSVENAGVAFVKGTDERIFFF